jgi:hypothetical protein
MHVQKFLKLLQQPSLLSEKDIPALEALIQEYPYFYLAHALLAKIAYREAQDAEKYVVQRAATYAIDRIHLHAWLENKCLFLLPAKTLQPKVTADTLAVPNNYLETIAKKAIKKSSNETSVQQFSVIEEILNKSLQFDPFVEGIPLQEESLVDLSKEGTTLDDRFATETLAHIMVKQKKYKRAIEIYESVMLKYPEKKSYLNGIISKLKNKT